jgi:hypothetical protein
MSNAAKRLRAQSAGDESYPRLIKSGGGFNKGLEYRCADADSMFSRKSRSRGLWNKIKRGEIPEATRKLIERDHAVEFAQFEREAARAA